MFLYAHNGTWHRTTTYYPVSRMNIADLPGTQQTHQLINSVVYAYEIKIHCVKFNTIHIINRCANMS